jgi:hypothetical protein
MLSAAYYRRQADICIRLAVAHSNESISARMLILGKAYRAVADEMIGRSQPTPNTEGASLHRQRPIGMAAAR